MTQDPIDRAFALMQGQRYEEAIHLLRLSLAQEPAAWNTWYLAGQCCRFLNDVDGAIACHLRAAELRPDEAPVFLALGIAFQLGTRWDDAVNAFRRAIEIDSDYELAYNSLALTQKKRGDFEKALHNYDAGAKALARRIVKSMKNERSSLVLKHRDTMGTLWVEYASYGALHLSATAEGIGSIAFPTGEQAMEEERSGAHAGLYWTDMENSKSETVRLFLPNYFNTFRESLRRESAYSNLIGNRGTVLELLGRHDDARRHIEEAAEFRPNGGEG